MTKHELLKKTRMLEEEAIKRLDPSIRPLFHLTGSTGWINDPNGFGYYNGALHLFFQAHPYSRESGAMHWGHVKSRDGIHWTHLPTALAPEEPYDKGGCFSGTALTYGDGRHLLFYTGVDTSGRTPGENRQTQCAAFGDGINYEKVSGNPVIGGSELPRGCSEIDFRDPKIWYDGRYYCLTVNRLEDNCAVVLFESEDALHWRCAGIPLKSGGLYGDMWECPDLFELDGEDVLLLSVIGMKPREGLKEGYVTLALRGQFDRKSCAYRVRKAQMLDEGIDFYAAQTCLYPDGRRVMIAWMQNWATVKEVPEGTDFNGQMTVPRELFLKNGTICSWPVKEIESLWQKKIVYENCFIQGMVSLYGIHGRMADMTLRICRHNSAPVLHVAVAADETFETDIVIDCRNALIRVDRTKSRRNPGSLNVREYRFPMDEEFITVRILLDRWSLEIFTGEGETASTFLLYTPQEADGIFFTCEEGAFIDLDFHELNEN